MIKSYLDEYNEEFDNTIKPDSFIESLHFLTLVYRTISDYEIDAIKQFCTIYSLRYTLSNSHNEIFYTIK